MASLTELAAGGKLSPMGPKGLSGPVSTPSPPEINGQQQQPIWSGKGPGAYWTDPGKSNTHQPGPGAPAGSSAVSDFMHSPLAQFLAGNSGQSNAQSYLNAFQSSLGAARGNIQQQLGAALSDIQNSQHAAGQALGQLPGQIDQAYGQANGTMASSVAAMQGAQQKSSGDAGSLMPVSATLAPERAAIAGSQSAAHANVPLLQTGIAQEGARESAMAHMAALNDQSQLDQLQAQGSLQAGLASQNQNNQLSPQQQFAEQVFLQNMQNQASMANIKAQAAANPPSSTYSPAAGTYGTNGLSASDVSAAHKSPQYATFAQEISSGKIKSLADLQKALPGNPALWRTLAVDFSLQ